MAGTLDGREVEPDCELNTVFPCMSGRVLTHDTFNPCRRVTGCREGTR